MRKVMVLEDEASIRSFIVINLRRAGYEVVEAETGEEALDKLHANPDTLVALLDVMLPGIDGFEVCRRIRATNPRIGIIMLTARSQEMDKVTGLMNGADDYVTKPFNILELKARIRALLRRAGGPAAQTPQRAPLLTVGDLSLDTEERVAIRDGKTIDLTAKEYDLIELLMKNPRRVYSRESLMDLVWGYSYAGDYRTVDVHIRRLREKLEPDPAKPVHIMTKWGVGYYFKGESQPTV